MMCNNCGKWAGAYAGFAKDHNLCNCVQHAPVKKEWVGLTDDDLAEFSDSKLGSYDLCLEVEALIKKKNT